jgi:hypothetical protein
MRASMPRSATQRLLTSWALGLAVLLVAACRTAAEPPPQAASFPAGERVAHSGAVALELTAARYDARHVSLTVSLTNRGKAPVRLDREGILLAYRDLEFPVLPTEAAPVAERTTLPPGGTVTLELGFGTEQLMVQAATLQLLSLRTGDDQWLAPLTLVVPPPAAFVDLEAEAEESAPYSGSAP